MGVAATVFGGIFMGCLIAAAVLMPIGYALLLVQILTSTNRLAAFREFWRCKDYRLLHRAAGNCIYTAAALGAIGCLTMFVWLRVSPKCG